MRSLIVLSVSLLLAIYDPPIQGLALPQQVTSDDSNTAKVPSQIPGMSNKLANEQLSPKLLSYLGRVLTIDPKLLKTGEERLEAKRQLGSSRIEEILKDATVDEQVQIIEDLERLEELAEKHPEVAYLVASLSSSEEEDEDYSGEHDHDDHDDSVESGSPKKHQSQIKDVKQDKPNPSSSSDTHNQKDKETTSSEETFAFYKVFTQADTELSKYDEWNRFWALWFKKQGDYLAKYG